VLGLAGAADIDLGMAGFAYGATLWPIQANSGPGTALSGNSWARAIDWVRTADSGGRRKVIILEVQTNPALGNYEQVLSVNAAIMTAIANGIVVCMAAGNRNAGLDDAGNPIQDTGSILVGAHGIPRHGEQARVVQQLRVPDHGRGARRHLARSDLRQHLEHLLHVRLRRHVGGHAQGGGHGGSHAGDRPLPDAPGDKDHPQGQRGGDASPLWYYLGRSDAGGSLRRSTVCLAIRASTARIVGALWARSSVGRAPPSHGGGQGFKSPRVHSENVILQDKCTVVKCPSLQSQTFYCNRTATQDTVRMPAG
jgi:hypothetical protein